MVDLENKRHNVINEPIIHWSESVMEKVALAPLHILLGLVNKLFSEAKPNHKPSNRNGRQLYKLHCLALCKERIDKCLSISKNILLLGELKLLY